VRAYVQIFISLFVLVNPLTRTRSAEDLAIVCAITQLTIEGLLELVRA
jgi:hypothetical protein